MKTLTRVTGEVLTLAFNPTGGLASAKFNGIDVTRDIRYVRESDYAALLRVFGFRETWSEEDKQIVLKVNEAIDKTGYIITNLFSLNGKTYNFFVSRNQKIGIHPFCIGSIFYDVERECVTRILATDRSFDTDLVESVIRLC